MYPQKLAKSYYCGNRCFKADWKLCHRQYHKDEEERRLRDEADAMKGEDIDLDFVSKIAEKENEGKSYMLFEVD